MDAAELAAYVGAAAWLPQIATWIYRVAIRPRVRIIPEQLPSIGFTTFGPIFNLNLALSAERKDALIDHLSMLVTHESGDTHRLIWEGHVESFQVRGSDASVQQTIERAMPPIAIKVGTVALVEKFVRFQDESFWDRQRPLFTALIERATHIRKTSQTPNQDILRSEDLARLLQLYEEFFWWRPGGYRVSFNISSQNGATLSPTDYTFTLHRNEVDALRANLATIAMDYENRISSGSEGYELKQIEWAWRNPRLIRAN